MIITDIANFILFLLIVYLCLQFIRAILFFIYIWQVKEYRLDRIWAHLFTLSGQKQLIYNLMLWQWKRPIFPKLTSRVFLTAILTIIWAYNLFFSSLKLFYLVYESPKFKLMGALIFSFTVVIIAVPIIVSLSTILISFLIWPVKKIIHYLAYRKIINFKKLIIIGITGSYGKSSTKEIISNLLSCSFKVLKTPWNCNTETGIVLFILRSLRKQHEMFIVEMGAYCRGEIKSICQIVRPQIGVITGINEQHLSLFGNLGNTIKSKGELIKSLPKDGLALFNACDNRAKKMYEKTTINKRLYGLKRNKISVQLPFYWYAQALDAGLIIGKYLGIQEKKLLKQAQKIKQLPWGLQIKKGRQGCVVIDDSYNSNPYGFKAALEVLKQAKGKTKLIITPGIIELGQGSKRIHRDLGLQAEKICQKIILTKADFYQILSNNLPKNFVEVWEDPVSLWEKLKLTIKRESVILLEGRVPMFIKDNLLK